MHAHPTRDERDVNRTLMKQPHLHTAPLQRVNCGFGGRRHQPQHSPLPNPLEYNQWISHSSVEMATEREKLKPRERKGREEVMM